MFIDIPSWLLILLLVLGGGMLVWMMLLVITFIGLWALHPRDAHDDINISDRKK